jgi:N-methylhydantoinase B
MYRATRRPGERFVNRTAGGGGHGDPLDRDPAAVAADVLDGYVTAEAAERDYGLIVAPDGSHHETPARAERRRTQPPADRHET